MNPILTVLALVIFACASPAATKPNIVYILCDDLGYGDVKCLNPQGKIATPHMDKLAAEGMIFTDAHSSSSVCTPTRYGIMTGRYNWRSRLQSGVLGGFSPRLIEHGRLTVAQMLKDQGYHTACIGKWHLGMDWAKKAGAEKAEPAKAVDFSKPIQNGPNSLGFDFYFGISASLDMPPYSFIENDRVTKMPTEEKEFPMFLGRAGDNARKGPGASDFEAEDVLPTLASKATDYVKSRAKDAKAGKPFFLYLPLPAPHTPVIPTKEWRGKSGLTYYGDFVMQTDAVVGGIMAELDRQGLAENTLVIFTSDNGCAPAAGFKELVALGHNPSHIFRGHKADVFDGGHRIPFIVRWPGQITPGSKSDQIICLTDFMATTAEILGLKVPATAGEDSVSFLSVLQGKAAKPVREAIVHHSINGSFVIRQANWKLSVCRDSGGWSEPRPDNPTSATLPDVQLYDLSKDIGEQTNVQDKHPEIVARLTKLLESYVADGRSTPGEKQKNTVPVTIRKTTKAKGKAVKVSGQE